ncbi:hypothetical protein [Bacillus paranthracis]|uniref:hypothetical protein n=1 Tax=Bacillus paranthracis TaxID=2026186 RepID=UPI002FDC02C4
MKEGIIYKVLSSTFVKSYHYHGSMFEYTWRFNLLDDNGEVIESVVANTRDDYKNLENEHIRLKKPYFMFDSVFEVVDMEAEERINSAKKIKGELKLEQIAEIIDANARMAYKYAYSGGTLKSEEQSKNMEQVEIDDLVTVILSSHVSAIHRVGYLRKRFYDKHNNEGYLIERLNGEIAEWSDCELIKVFESYVFD